MGVELSFLSRCNAVDLIVNIEHLILTAEMEVI
jgi:hypothetical protein